MILKNDIIVIQAKMFKCILCEKGFGTKTFLELHLLTHSEIKSFVYHICKRAFKTKTFLRMHSHYHN